MTELTHASFFTGAGGLDIGLHRAGWRTVSHSEIDPYACAVLRERWPDIPNLGDIVDLAAVGAGGDGTGDADTVGRPERDGRAPIAARGADWRDATLWSGGFPCQDLSIAGRRLGFGEGERSVLAFAFLDLVGRHRPPWVLLENVPGLLSSNAGRDLGRLLAALGHAGYGWAYRVLDAQWFGVPQRRRRVFILAHHADGRPDADGPAEVLAVGTRCGRDHAQERTAWADAAGRAGRGAGIVDQAISSKWAKRSSGPAGDEHHHLVVGTLREHVRPGSNTDHTVVQRAEADPAGVRAPDGLAGWAHDRSVAATLNSGGNNGGFRTEPGEHLVYVKAKRAQSTEDDESWRDGDVSPTLNSFDVGDTRATVLTTGPVADDDLLPLGLDSHRYRVIGNGVAAPVATWIGGRLAAWLACVS